MFFFRNSGFFLSQEMRSWFQKPFIGIQDSFYHKKRGVGYKNGFQEFRILSIIKDESWIPKILSGNSGFFLSQEIPENHFCRDSFVIKERVLIPKMFDFLGIQDSFYHKKMRSWFQKWFIGIQDSFYPEQIFGIHEIERILCNPPLVFCDKKRNLQSHLLWWWISGIQDSFYHKRTRVFCGFQKYSLGIQDSFYHKKIPESWNPALVFYDRKNPEFLKTIVTHPSFFVIKRVLNSYKPFLEFFFRNSGFFLSQEMRSWFQKWFIGIQDSFYHKKRGVGYKNGFQEFRILSIIKDESWIPKILSGNSGFFLSQETRAGFQKCFFLGIQDSFYHKRWDHDSKNGL